MNELEQLKSRCENWLGATELRGNPILRDLERAIAIAERLYGEALERHLDAVKNGSAEIRQARADVLIARNFFDEGGWHLNFPDTIGKWMEDTEHYERNRE